MGALLDRYRDVASPGAVDVLEKLARPLAGMRVLRINSTRLGGGVAEMLHTMLPLLEDLGLRPRWEVILGNAEFYAVTKAFHNALQGRTLALTNEMRAAYTEVLRANAARMDFTADAVIVDDPQPAALIEKKDRHVPWLWRCHIDLSRPDRDFWGFLSGYVSRYDAAIFSLPKFCRRLPVPQYLVWPAIDPLSEKNAELPESEISTTLSTLGVPTDRPIILQVSRFDRFKDPVGVIKAFRLVRRRIPCILVLAGGSADDDPEGAVVLEEVRAAAQEDPDIRVLLLPPTAHRQINALQRAATVVVQKSTREGFGLTVTEALWKRKPVIGGLAGGIAVQILHGVNGYLVSSIEGAAFRILKILENPDLARRMGEEGREHVRRNFLVTRKIRDYLVLLKLLQGRVTTRRIVTSSPTVGL